MQYKHLAISALVAASSLASVSSVANSEIQPKVIGGSDSSETYPWMVSVTERIGDGLFHTCGGALIDEEWVLTAAHCIDDSRVSSTYLVIGARDFINDEVEQIQAEEFIIHEDYNLTTFHVDNDIALIKLSEPSSNETVSMADSQQTNALAEGTLLTLIGWGSTVWAADRDPQPSDYPSILQEVEIPLSTQAQCAELYSGTDSDILCAGAEEGGVDACDGDSGGPLFIEQGGEHIHLGLVSYADGCALAGKYGVYTKTAAYQDWIEDQMNPSFSSGGGSSSGGSLGWLFALSLSFMTMRARKTK